MIDQFYMHEALDRTALVSSIVDEHLVDHPAVQMHPEVRALVSEASSSLQKAYQLLAKLSLEEGSHS